MTGNGTDAALGGLTPEQYISERVKQYQAWYDRKAVACKARYLRMRAWSVVGAASVPVLVNVDALPVAGYSVPLKPVVTLMSLLVVVLVSLESVFHYRAVEELPLHGATPRARAVPLQGRGRAVQGLGAE